MFQPSSMFSTREIQQKPKWGVLLGHPLDKLICNLDDTLINLDATQMNLDVTQIKLLCAIQMNLDVSQNNFDVSQTNLDAIQLQLRSNFDVEAELGINANTGARMLIRRSKIQDF